MPKLAPIAREDMTDEQGRVYDAIASSARGGVRGPFPALLRRPELAERVAVLGDVVRFGTSFSPRLLELAVLVTARTERCELEWHAHSLLAAKEGLSAEVIEAIRVDGVPPFAEDADRVVHDFVRELQERHVIGDTTYKAAVDLFGELGVVDLAAIVGYFAMVASSINAHGLLFSADAEPPFDDHPVRD